MVIHTLMKLCIIEFQKSCLRRIQRGLEAGILVWSPKLVAQKSSLIQYILSSIHSDK